MKVKALSLVDLDEATYFSYKIIRHKENITPYLPDDFNSIRKHFEKLINHPTDQVFGCFKRGKIVGILATVIYPSIKQITSVGGVLTDISFKYVANSFNKFFKEHYASFSVIYYAYEENIKARIYMDSSKSTLFEIRNEYIFKPREVLFHSPIKLLEDEDKEKFLELNKTSKYKYTGEKMLEYKDHFHIYVREETNDLVGYFAVKTNCSPLRIIETKVKGDKEDLETLEKIFESSLLKEGRDCIYSYSIEKTSIINEIVQKQNVLDMKTIYSYRLDY